MAQDKDDPTKQLKQGIGLLWRAARGAASTVKTELDRNGIAKSLDDAGREVARAATNVIGRIGSEIQKAQQGSHPPPPPKKPDENDEREPEKTKPKGPTKSDPGFRIAVDDDPSKDHEPR